MFIKSCKSLTLRSEQVFDMCWKIISLGWQFQFFSKKFYLQIWGSYVQIVIVDDKLKKRRKKRGESKFEVILPTALIVSAFMLPSIYSCYFISLPYFYEYCSHLSDFSSPILSPLIFSSFFLNLFFSVIHIQALYFFTFLFSAYIYFFIKATFYEKLKLLKEWSSLWLEW